MLCGLEGLIGLSSRPRNWQDHRPALRACTQSPNNGVASGRESGLLPIDYKQTIDLRSLLSHYSSWLASS